MAPLKLSGVTGTNGKSSTTFYLAAMLNSDAAPSACVTTVGTYLGMQRYPAPLSFPGMLQTMRACLDGGGHHMVLEITSETLARGFAQRWPCEVGVFTNLSHDHLDAHGSVEHYFASKAQLFHTLSPGGTAVIHGNDEVAPLLMEVLPKEVRCVSYGMANKACQLPADIVGHNVRLTWHGTELCVALGAEPDARRLTLRVPTVGEVFAENALGALAAAMAWGVEPELAAERLANSGSIPGRFECVAEAPRVVIDYAHTPDALERTLNTARRLCGGELRLVFGAGGGRDRDKRPLMGRAAMLADRVWLTTDNPRHEDPTQIEDDLMRGMGDCGKLHRVPDRREAIERAIADADPADVVLIAGKGHEMGQIVGDQVLPFSDREEALAAVARRG